MSVNFNLHQNREVYKKNNTVIAAKKQSFGGIGDAITTALVASDKSPMIGVSIIDLASMISPRTIVDATRNGFAATETFLRESAGLIINCLIPGFVVMGMAKLLEKPIMGEFASHSPFKFWANQDSNNALASAWLNTKNIKDKTKRVNAFVSTILDNISGLEGKGNWKQIAKIDGKEQIYKQITDAILDTDPKRARQTIIDATDTLIEKLGASRNIKLVDNHTIRPMKGLEKIALNTDLSSLLKEMKDLGSSFVKMADSQVPDFTKKLTTLVKSKSALGLAVVIAMGASFQYFNRMITKYRTGSSDFVGEADYVEQLKKGQKADKKEFCEKEHRKLNFHKLLGTLGMGLLAVLSFNKLPTGKMFQFNNSFPSMNQCRAISAVTYSGRIISAANDNELKESALRDTCTFVNLYYLGDYVSKAFATLSSQKDKLLNEKVKLAPDATMLQKFWHWFKNTELKGFEEIAKNDFSARKTRAFAQASGLIYSCIVLGLIVPLYNKHRTNKKAEQKALFSRMQFDLDSASKLDEKKIFTDFINNKPQLA